METFQNLQETKLSSQPIFDGNVLHIYKDTVRLPNGKEAAREYTVHHGAVCILPLLENGDVLLERQFRYPIGAVVTEIPAGKLDYIGEDPHEAALRELREETGAVAQELIPLGVFYPACAYSTEAIHMFIARGLSFGERELDEAQQTLKAAVDARAQLEAKRNQTEKQAQEKNQSILQLERETARLEQKKATSELEEKQIIDRLWDSYELTPGTAEKEIVEIENLPAANKRIGEVRRKISALGTPNLGAIDEYARVSERYEYLTAQRDDVQHAKSELETIVASITTEMTEIFVREFARIDEYFGKTFAEMFGGGKASLILEDKSAPLECGIEIRVQPPGKQVKTITLLSGGEKAFVAIALYFAILKVRPTPFCMLDEIDAALDDRNVERFASYLHTLSDKTQFIVITHRRGTMEAADVLYGVTMQEQGVSKILRLSLDELAKQLGITA